MRYMKQWNETGGTKKRNGKKVMHGEGLPWWSLEFQKLTARCYKVQMQAYMQQWWIQFSDRAQGGFCLNYKYKDVVVYSFNGKRTVVKPQLVYK